MPPPRVQIDVPVRKSNENVDISVTPDFTRTYLFAKIHKSQTRCDGNIEFYWDIYSRSWKTLSISIFQNSKIDLTAEWHHFIQCHPPVRKFHVFPFFVRRYRVTAHPVRICRYLLDYSPVHRFSIVERLTTAAPQFFIDTTRWFWHNLFWYPHLGRSSRYLRRWRAVKKQMLL